MTAIAAIVDDDGLIVMAADSQATDGSDLTYHAERKISRLPVGEHDEALLGLAGPSGMHRRITDGVNLTAAPNPADPESVGQWAQAVADAVYDVISEAPKTIGGDPDDDYRSYTGLLAHAGRLWLLTESGQVLALHRGYHAIGSGQQVALGALHALRTPGGEIPGIRALRAVHTAVTAAIEHRADCGPPITIEQLPPRERHVIGVTPSEFLRDRDAQS